MKISIIIVVFVEKYIINKYRCLTLLYSHVTESYDSLDAKCFVCLIIYITYKLFIWAVFMCVVSCAIDCMYNDVITLTTTQQLANCNFLRAWQYGCEKMSALSPTAPS